MPLRLRLAEKINNKTFSITKNELEKILGPIQFESELALRRGIPGVVTGLAYTPFGGDLLFVEAASMPGKGNAAAYRSDWRRDERKCSGGVFRR